MNLFQIGRSPRHQRCMKGIAIAIRSEKGRIRKASEMHLTKVGADDVEVMSQEGAALLGCIQCCRVEGKHDGLQFTADGQREKLEDRCQGATLNVNRELGQVCLGLMRGTALGQR